MITELGFRTELVSSGSAQRGKYLTETSRKGEWCSACWYLAPVSVRSSPSTSRRLTVASLWGVDVVAGARRLYSPLTARSSATTAEHPWFTTRHQVRLRVERRKWIQRDNTRFNPDDKLGTLTCFNRLRGTEHSRFSVWTFNFPLPEYHYLTLSLQRMVAVAVRFTRTYNWSSTHKATHYRVRYKAQSYAYAQNAQNQIFSKQNKRINHTRILFLWIICTCFNML